jgi:hypothetical protein
MAEAKMGLKGLLLLALPLVLLGGACVVLGLWGLRARTGKPDSLP